MIKDILDNLSAKDRDQLQYALENDFSQEVLLDDGTFIGINVYVTECIEVIEQINNWLYGRRKC